MVDIFGTLLTTPRRPVATSALPDAPVVDEAHHWAHQVLATALRVLGRGSRRLADRVEPARRRDGGRLPDRAVQLRRAVAAQPGPDPA
jgi:hypothetical protein